MEMWQRGSMGSGAECWVGKCMTGCVARGQDNHTVAVIAGWEVGLCRLKCRAGCRVGFWGLVVADVRTSALPRGVKTGWVDKTIGNHLGTGCVPTWAGLE
jgi:hypothetical protein